MANITLFVPDELKKRMAEHEHLRWSSVIRSIIEQRLADFEEAEELAKESNLTPEDVGRIAAEVGEAVGRHAEHLLKKRGIA
ncbi:hypothetical protein HZC09_01940 [Candidatus Micrarchaeota archaeon]|nr:hypothetical protein [Candidatus Micrarchaeota archaeon]